MIETKVLGAVLAGCLLMLLSGFTEASIVFRMAALFSENTFDQMLLSRFLLMSPVGGIIGCYLFCILAELIGRKYALAALSLPLIISHLIFASSNAIAFIFLGQIICGLTSGGGMAFIPVYLGEICDKTTRGQIIVFLYVSQQLGHLILLSTLTAISPTNVTLIIQYAIIIAISLIATAVALITITESSHYKFRKVGINTTGVASRNEHELNELNVQIDSSIQAPSRYGIRKQFNLIGWIKPVLLVAGAIFFRHLSGMHVIGISIRMIMMQLPLSSVGRTIIYVVPNLVALFACPFLVDRMGRKFCLIISYAGAAITISAFRLLIHLRRNEDDTLCNSLIVLVALLFSIFYHLGAGPIPLVLIGEMLPAKMKMISSALCCGLYYAVVCLVLLLQLTLTNNIWMYIDIWFSASFVVIVYLLYIETRGKSLEEIQTMLKVTA